MLLVAAAVAVLASACGGQAGPSAAASKPATSPSAPAASRPNAAVPTVAASGKPNAASSRPSAGASGYSPAPLNPPVDVRIGLLFSTSDSGVLIALDKGYFKDEGINVQTHRFQSLVNMVAPLGAGQLDIAGGALAAGLFNAAARDVPLKIVADKGQTIGSAWDFVALMVRKDLTDSGRVKDYGDLKGLTIATSGKGNSTEIELAHALAKANLTLNDVHWVNMGFPDMVTAFGNKGIDAAMVIEPFVSRLVGLGTAARWKGSIEFSGNQQVAIIAYGPSFVKRTDVARRWMIAYLRGVRDYNDAFGPKKKGRDEVVKILAKYTAVKDPKTYDKMIPAGIDPNGKPNVQGMEKDLAYYEQAGEVTQKVNLASMTDMSFQAHAISKLGPY